MDIALAGQRCAVERSLALADHEAVEVRFGPGWLGVRSGAASNDLNVVVSDPGFRPWPDLLDGLRAWFNDVSASWLVREPDVALTRVLSDHGWRAERTGRWCGRVATGDVGHDSLAEIVVVTDASELTGWLEVASGCGWCEDIIDRRVRGALLRGFVEDPRHTAWVARLAGRPVGMATGWCAGEIVEVVDVAVREEARRQGIGRGLVADVLRWGEARGAVDVVAAPSPNGWRLFEALGFANVPVVPDVCFYLF